MAVDLTQVSKVDTQPGELPETMAAWVIREERYGEPMDAFQVEEIEMKYGDHPEHGHHIGGSDASGVVWKVGPGVHALEGGRRGRHPLQLGLLRGPRGPRPRSDGRPVAARLGL